jgi:hypothetical protein
MKKRLFVALGLTLLVCLLLPGVALARGTTSFTGVGSQYTVVKGGNLTVAGTIVGDPGADNWNRHPRIKIQRYVHGKWHTIKFVRPKGYGAFSTSLKKPVSGSYRVFFPGCVHYHSKAQRFTLKYDPQLSVDAPTTTGEIRPLRFSYDSLVSTTVRSALSASNLGGGYLTLRSYASTDGVTYTLVGTVPSPISFGRSNSVLVSGILVPGFNADDDI